MSSNSDDDELITPKGLKMSNDKSREEQTAPVAELDVRPSGIPELSDPPPAQPVEEADSAGLTHGEDAATTGHPPGENPVVLEPGCETGNTLAPTTEDPKYKPTPQELQSMRTFRARREAAIPAPRLKVQDKKIAVDHPAEHVGYASLMNALGTADFDFLNQLLAQLANSSPGQTEQGVNFMISVIKGFKPRDQVEAMLATQMAAVHMAFMTSAQRLAVAQTIPHADSAERAFNKLARTFATQIEALKRYQTGGEEKVTVQHVSVSQGSQAIVGT
jgi:hypothetical protein